MPKFGCLMLVLPHEAACIVREWGASQVAPEFLYGDGLETFTHVTAKYGFTETPLIVGCLRDILSRVRPPSALISGLSSFPDGGDGDVLKLDVESDDLHALYHLLSERFSCEDRFYPDYQPHTTVAYVTPGMGEGLAELDPPPPLEITFKNAIYSDAQGRKTVIPFGGKVMADLRVGDRVSVVDDNGGEWIKSGTVTYIGDRVEVIGDDKISGMWPARFVRKKTLSAMDSTAGGALIAPPSFPSRLYTPRRKVIAPVVKRWDRLGKGIEKKKDKRGYNICYDTDSGKRAPCNPKPGGAASAPKKPNEPKAPKEKPQKASAEQLEHSLRGAMESGAPTTLGAALGINNALLQLTDTDIRNLRQKFGLTKGGKKGDKKGDKKADRVSSLVEHALAKVGIERPGDKLKRVLNEAPDQESRLTALRDAVAGGLTAAEAYDAVRKLDIDPDDAMELAQEAMKASTKVPRQRTPRKPAEKQPGKPQAGPQPPEPGFTGEDDNGHCWQDGVMIPCEELEGDDGRSGTDRAGDEGAGGESAGDGGEVEGETERLGDQTATQSGDSEAGPTGASAANSLSSGQGKRVIAEMGRINKKLDTYEKFFRRKGQGHVADWVASLRKHVNEVGGPAALAALGPPPPEGTKQTEGPVQYWGVGTEEQNWKNMGQFIEAYLGRNGIIAVTGDTSDPSHPLISALGAPDRYVADQDFKPEGMYYTDKLTESKDLPGLETSEDVSTLMGKPVTHLGDEEIKKLDETYGPGRWIVKCYDDNAAAGYGIFFPQRVAKIAQDARQTIWDAGSKLSQYGFSLDRDPQTNKVIGIKHEGGDVYRFGSPEYESTIHGDAREWGDRAYAASHNEKGAMLPEGSFMAQPAFQAVGISDAERAAGKTWHEKNEGRVHLVTRPDGTVTVVPHATWLKGGNLPVVFEDDDTRAMAQAAKEAIEKIPPEGRKGQVYAPDVMKTPDGYRVVELNAQGDNNGSGYLHDNGFTIDAYTSYLTGREPLHVQFIRSVLTERQRSAKGEKNFSRLLYRGMPVRSGSIAVPYIPKHHTRGANG